MEDLGPGRCRDSSVSKLTAFAKKLWLVGVRGFEPPAPASRTQCSTRLSYTPAKAAHIAPRAGPGKASLQARSLTARDAMQVGQALQHVGDAFEHFVEALRLGQGEIRVNRGLDRCQEGRG